MFVTASINKPQHHPANAKPLFQADPKLAKLKDQDGRLPIHWAASANNSEIFSLLVNQKGFDPDIQVFSPYLTLPFHLFISSPIVILITFQDDSGWTALMIAASVKDSDKIVDLLLAKGADTNQTSEHPVTLPSLSLLFLRDETNSLLSDNTGQVSPPFLTSQSNLGPNHLQTVLHFVASKSNLDLARKLLLDQKPPASARVRDKRGQYPLHRAAAVGSVPMINLLLQARSPLNATDNAGYTALHHAVAEGHGESSLMSRLLVLVGWAD